MAQDMAGVQKVTSERKHVGAWVPQRRLHPDITHGLHRHFQLHLKIPDTASSPTSLVLLLVSPSPERHHPISSHAGQKLEVPDPFALSHPTHPTDMKSNRFLSPIYFSNLSPFAHLCCQHPSLRNGSLLPGPLQQPLCGHLPVFVTL